MSSQSSTLTPRAWPPAPGPLGGDRPDLVGFGEAMVLIQPAAGESLATADDYEVHVAGAELNAAAAVASVGGHAVFCTRLGDDPFGVRVKAAAERLGVGVAADVDPDRPTALFAKQTRPGGAREVYYYRAGSAASALAPGDADRGLAGPTGPPRAVLVSGLTAALSASAGDLVAEVVRRAAGVGTAVVLDVNLRRQLGRRAEVRDLLASLLPAVDLMVVGTDEAADLLGAEEPAAIIAAALAAGVGEVVVTGGADGCWFGSDVSAGDVSGDVSGGETGIGHRPSLAGTVVDPVGAGDAFTGGYVAARLAGADPAGAAELASRLAAAVLAHTGDTTGLPELPAGADLLHNVLLLSPGPTSG